MPDFPTISFLVVSDLYERYIIVVNAGTKMTSVYCEECEMWVNQYEGDLLSTQDATQLLDTIVADHENQVKGTPVEFSENKFF